MQKIKKVGVVKLVERVDKIISNLGYGSRKEIKQLARKGLIEVDGEIIKIVVFQ